MTTSETTSGPEPENLQALAENLPIYDISTKARSDGFSMRRFAGATIFSNEDMPQDSTVSDTLLNDLRDYLDPNEKLGAFDQVGILDRLFLHMGLAAPTSAMHRHHYKQLQATLMQNPGKRLLPVPLNSLKGINLIAGYENSPSRSGLVLCQEAGFDFGNVLRPQINYTYSNSQRPFYRDYYGGLSSYDSLIKDLVNGGQTVEDLRGNRWVFPVIDAEVKTTRKVSPEKTRWVKPMDPIRLPEVLAMLRVIQNAAGYDEQVLGQIDLSSARIYKTHLGSGIAFESQPIKGIVGITDFAGRLATGILPNRGDQLPSNFIARDTLNGLPLTSF